MKTVDLSVHARAQQRDCVLRGQLPLLEVGGFALLRGRKKRSSIEVCDLSLQRSMLLLEMLEGAPRIEGLFGHAILPQEGSSVR
jgi:hypothetical protein